MRDCDGTELPVGVSKLAKKVYKTYFVGVAITILHIKATNICKISL